MQFLLCNKNPLSFSGGNTVQTGMPPRGIVPSRRHLVKRWIDPASGRPIQCLFEPGKVRVEGYKSIRTLEEGFS